MRKILILLLALISLCVKVQAAFTIIQNRGERDIWIYNGQSSATNRISTSILSGNNLRESDFSQKLRSISQTGTTNNAISDTDIKYSTYFVIGRNDSKYMLTRSIATNCGASLSKKFQLFSQRFYIFLHKFSALNANGIALFISDEINSTVIACNNPMFSPIIKTENSYTDISRLSTKNTSYSFHTKKNYV